MLTEVLMPKWGYMTDGIIVEWMKDEGDLVEKGQPIFVVETEKVTQEVEAPETGILLKKIHPVGSLVPVGEVVAIIGEKENNLAEKSLPLEDEIEDDTVTAPKTEYTDTEQPERISISPAARRLAREYGIDKSTLTGTGPKGRIVKADVLKAHQSGIPSNLLDEPEILEEISLSETRKATSDRMAKSSREAAQATISTEIDGTNMVIQHRESNLKKGKRVDISYTDIVLWAVSRALLRNRIMNSTLEGDSIKIYKDVNLGLAVATERGILVPVIRNADKRSLPDIAALRRDFVERAGKGALSISDVINGTFTVTNLGMYGVDIFTPILNPPQIGILGVGRIREKPVVENGEIISKPTLNMSLTFDHRVIDGAPAARFLQQITELLESSDFT